MKNSDIFNSKDIHKEFEDFLENKFGGQVKVLADELRSFTGAQQVKDDGQEEAKKENSKKHSQFDFSYNPKALKKYLDRFVVGQDEAKKALSIAVCDHYAHLTAAGEHAGDEEAFNYAKQNVLITGPTGVGKTYMVKQIARLIGVPFVKADATRFSETGYMGANVDDLIKDLVEQANGDIEQAQLGIVYLDEADKIAHQGQVGGRDVNGRGVQLGLLKLMEETDVDLRAGNDPASQMQAFFEMQKKGKAERQVVNTRHILFIVSGAFTGLDDIITKRVKPSRMGFSSNADDLSSDKNKLLSQAKTDDFVKYGFEPEFIGRLPVRVACESLDEHKLYEILKHSEGSILKQYVRTFRHYGIDLLVEDDALKAVAKLAAAEGTGARALMTVFEDLLRDYKFELPGSLVTKLVLDKALVENPKERLKEILLDLENLSPSLLREIRSFEAGFYKAHDVKIEFDMNACHEICDLAEAKGVGAAEVCAQTLSNYEHGLKLIRKNTGQCSFVFGVELVKSPTETLEKLVANSYRL